MHFKSQDLSLDIKKGPIPLHVLMEPEGYKVFHP